MSAAMAFLSMHSPVGPLTLFTEDDALVAVDWGRAPDGRSTPLLAEARRQFDAYFDGRLRSFDLPLNPAGTAFQRRVWQAMQAIPYGETRTYGDIADAVGSAARAVGGACGRNPLPIVIPCHRVVAGGGRPGGYSGDGGVETKRILLTLEGVAVP